MPISASRPRHRQVGQVQLVEVDPVGAQPAQRVRRRPGAGTPGEASSPGGLPGRLVEGVAPLGGDHGLVPAAGERPAEHPLAVPGAVRVGGVEEGDAEVERPAYRPHRLVVVDRAPAQRLGALRPGAADRPAPHAEGADLDAAAAQRPCRDCHRPIVPPSQRGAGRGGLHARPIGGIATPPARLGVAAADTGRTARYCGPPRVPETPRWRRSAGQARASAHRRSMPPASGPVHGSAGCRPVVGAVRGPIRRRPPGRLCPGRSRAVADLVGSAVALLGVGRRRSVVSALPGGGRRRPGRRRGSPRYDVGLSTPKRARPGHHQALLRRQLGRPAERAAGGLLVALGRGSSPEMWVIRCGVQSRSRPSAMPSCPCAVPPLSRSRSYGPARRAATPVPRIVSHAHLAADRRT